MVAAALGMGRVMTALAPAPHFVSELLRLGISIVVAILILVASARALRMEEFDEAILAIRSRIPSRRAAAT